MGKTGCRKQEDYVLLDADFKTLLFDRLRREFGGLSAASRKLGLSRGILQAYACARSKYLRKSFVEKIALATNLGGELNEHAVDIQTGAELIQTQMSRGRVLRNEFLKKLKVAPPLNQFLQCKTIDVGQWFTEANYLLRWKQSTMMDFVSVIDCIDYLTVAYRVFGRDFETVLPKRLVIDSDFAYFFGLWLGDRAGVNRFGVTNQDLGVVRKTIKILREKFLQPKEAIKLDVLLPAKNASAKIFLEEDLAQYLNKCFKAEKEHRPTYVAYSLNTPISEMLVCLSNAENLPVLLDLFNENELDCFYAGFFDAEGHVNVIDRNLKIAQNDGVVKKAVVEKLSLEFSTRYDGKNIVVEDYGEFGKRILQHLCSDKKEVLKKLLCGDVVKDSYLLFAAWVSRNKSITRKSVAVAFKKKRVDYIVSALKKAGYLKEDSVLGVTALGEKWISENNEKITSFLREAKTFGFTTKGKFYFDSKAIESMAGVMQV